VLSRSHSDRVARRIGRDEPVLQTELFPVVDEGETREEVWRSVAKAMTDADRRCRLRNG